MRVGVKSPVREYRPPGSVRGAPGDRRPYLDHRTTHEWTRFDTHTHSHVLRLAEPRSGSGALGTRSSLLHAPRWLRRQLIAGESKRATARRGRTATGQPALHRSADCLDFLQRSAAELAATSVAS